MSSMGLFAPIGGVDILNDRFVEIIDEGFEAVFRIGPIGKSNLGAIELAPFQKIACGSPAYLGREPINLPGCRLAKVRYAPRATKFCCAAK